MKSTPQWTLIFVLLNILNFAVSEEAPFPTPVGQLLIDKNFTDGETRNP
ncbi:MAG: hypothetical protein V4507_06875 [Verrucomicrobiota bacterium]